MYQYFTEKIDFDHFCILITFVSKELTEKLSLFFVIGNLYWRLLFLFTLPISYFLICIPFTIVPLLKR